MNSAPRRQSDMNPRLTRGVWSRSLAGVLPSECPMKTPSISLALLVWSVSFAASTAAESKLYFPPSGKDWQQVSPEAAGFDADKLEAALDFAGENKSSGVVVLWRGRVLAEKHWPLDRANGASIRYLSGARGTASPRPPGSRPTNSPASG